MQVIVEGLMTNYQKSGSGPVVLLLHGWGDDLNTFVSLRKMFSSSRTVVALDLPGFGGTETPKQTFDLEKYASFVSKFLEKISVSNIQSIVGHSNGGAIAIKGVANGILDPENLILIASSGVRSDSGARKKFLRIAAKTAKVPTKLLPKTTQAKIKKKAYQTIGSDLFIAENMQDTFKQVVGEDLVSQAKIITTPTLLIYGSNDSATPSEYGKMYADAIKGSELKIIDGAEHFVHQTNSNQVEQIIDEFLRKGVSR